MLDRAQGRNSGVHYGAWAEHPQQASRLRAQPIPCIPIPLAGPIVRGKTGCWGGRHNHPVTWCRGTGRCATGVQLWSAKQLSAALQACSEPHPLCPVGSLAVLVLEGPRTPPPLQTPAGLPDNCAQPHAAGHCTHQG